MNARSRKIMTAILSLSYLGCLTACSQPVVNSSISSADTQDATTQITSIVTSELSSESSKTEKPIIDPGIIIENPEDQLPEYYTEDPENEIYLGNGKFVKINELEKDSEIANSYIIRGSMDGYEYEPYDNNSIRNPEDYNLAKMRYVGSKSGPVVSQKKTTVHTGDIIGDNGLVVDSCYISIEPRVTYSDKLKKNIGVGYDVVRAEISLKGNASFTGILIAERYNVANTERDGESRLLFLPYSEEFHKSVPFLFDVDVQHRQCDCAMFYNYGWGEPKFAITTSDAPICIGYLKDYNYLNSDVFSENIYYKEATITFSDLKYYFNDRSSANQLSGTVISIDNICDLK